MAQKVMTNGSVNGGSVLPEIQFVGTRQYVDTTRVLSAGGSHPPMAAAGERPEFDIKSPLGDPVLIFPQGYLLKSFPQGVHNCSPHVSYHAIAFMPFVTPIQPLLISEKALK